MILSQFFPQRRLFFLDRVFIVKNEFILIGVRLQNIDDFAFNGGDSLFDVGNINFNLESARQFFERGDDEESAVIGLTSGWICLAIRR